MVCGPTGTLRRVYLPSVPVTVLWPVLCTVTDTLASAEPSAVRVTVPVTVPVSWAPAEPGASESRRREAARRPRSDANRGRGIPFVLIGGWLGLPAAAMSPRAETALGSGTGMEKYKSI
jgi:hypothetical protein